MDLRFWWNQNRENIVKRLKSLLWRAGCLGGIAAVSSILENLAGLGLPVWLQGFLGLGLGEVTKWLNNHTDMFGGRQK